MQSERMRRRARFMHEARAYATSREPTAHTLHALCSRFVEMLAADRGERVELAIGKVIVARSAPGAELGVVPR